MCRMVTRVASSTPQSQASQYTEYLDLSEGIFSLPLPTRFIQPYARARSSAPAGPMSAKMPTKIHSRAHASYPRHTVSCTINGLSEPSFYPRPRLRTRHFGTRGIIPQNDAVNHDLHRDTIVRGPWAPRAARWRLRSRLSSRPRRRRQRKKRNEPRHPRGCSTTRA